MISACLFDNRFDFWCLSKKRPNIIGSWAAIHTRETFLAVDYCLLNSKCTLCTAICNGCQQAKLHEVTTWDYYFPIGSGAITEILVARPCGESAIEKSHFSKILLYSQIQLCSCHNAS